jgi:hypothetical protein
MSLGSTSAVTGVVEMSSTAESTAAEVAPETSNSTAAVDSTGDINVTATPNAPDTEWGIYLGIGLAVLCCLILIIVALVLVRRRRAAAANKSGAEMQPTDYFLDEDDGAGAKTSAAPQRQNIYASTPMALGQSPTASAVIYDSAM